MCGDSHTSTHGALGALAFGIGTTEVGHVLATQCLLQRRPKTFAINVTGGLPTGVTAKDLILAIIGADRHRRRHRPRARVPRRAIRALDMEERMTVCNMSIEGGARAGMIAPDETTYAYLAGRPAPQGEAWERALAQLAHAARPMRTRASTARSGIDAGAVEPMITYGTNPGMVIPISGAIPARRGMRPLRARSPTWD